MTGSSSLRIQGESTQLPDTPRLLWPSLKEDYVTLRDHAGDLTTERPQGGDCRHLASRGGLGETAQGPQESTGRPGHPTLPFTSWISLSETLVTPGAHQPSPHLL